MQSCANSMAELKFMLKKCRFAAALSQQKVWVMSVVPVHSPDALPIIFERGLVGIYHDWCESFGTYPRSYDLLHADHLLSRLKNRLVFVDLSSYGVSYALFYFPFVHLFEKIFSTSEIPRGHTLVQW